MTNLMRCWELIHDFVYKEKAGRANAFVRLGAFDILSGFNWIQNLQPSFNIKDLSTFGLK